MANNWKIGAIAELDDTQSRNQLNSDIKGLSRNLDKLKLYAEIDKNQVTQLQNQLKNLQIQLNNVTISDSAINGLVAKINASLQNINIGNINIGNQSQNVGQQIGNNIAQGVVTGVNKAKSELKSFSDLTNFSELNKKIEHLQIDPSALKNYNAILDGVKTKYAEFGQVKITNEQFNNGVLEKFKVNIEQVNGDLKETKSFIMALNDDKDTFVFDGIIKGSESVVQHLDKTKNAVNQTADAINALKDKAKADKIQLLFDNGHGDSAYGNRIKQIENDFVKYGLSVDEASQKTQTLRNILNGFKDTDGNFLPDDKLVAQANKLETEFKAVKVSVDSAKLSYDKFLQPVSSDKASSLIIRINDFLTKNTAITKEAKEELLGFIRLLQNGNVNLSDWNKFDTRLKEINQEMRVAGKLGKSLKQTLIDGAKSFAQWTLSSGAVMEVWNGFKQGIRNVKELDDSLVELNKVTDLTVEGLSKVTEESFELGEKLAKTGTKVLDSVTSFSRAGYNIEDSMKYAEEALKTTNISENLKDAGQSADSLVNIMKGFQDETPEFAKKINDSVNQVSNTEAVDFDNLIDGATRLSAVADQAGMSFEQMLGTLTGAYEVLGNMEKVSNGQITIFTRLQAIQMEGEEEVSTVAKLQDKFSNATNGAVNIVDKTTGQLRNVYDILDDLSDVWDTLDKNTQEALAFEAAGTRQKNVFLSMMQNWQGVEDAVKSAENSIGSADEENQAYLNSLSGKLEDLESALQHISKTLIDSNLLKFFVDLGTTGVKSIDGLISILGGMDGVLGASGGIALNKILG